MSENLREIINRVKAGNHSSEDIQSIVYAIYVGELILANGAGSVVIGGNASNATIVTGDGNTIVYSADESLIELVIETIKRTIQEELPLRQREYGNPVSQGLNVLTELMQYPEARSTVITFRVNFQAACEQINLIAHYKDLHDLLHNLEFYCYNGIVHELTRFSNDELSLDILTEHELTLQKILREIQEVVDRETIITNDVSWLQDLERAQIELHIAIEETDNRRLQQSVRLLNRVLAIQPSRLNTNLNSAARTLRLPTLVNAMNLIGEKLAVAELNQEKMQRFQQGVEMLAT